MPSFARKHGIAEQFRGSADILELAAGFCTFQRPLGSIWFERAAGVPDFELVGVRERVELLRSMMLKAALAYDDAVSRLRISQGVQVRTTEPFCPAIVEFEPAPPAAGVMDEDWARGEA